MKLSQILAVSLAALAAALAVAVPALARTAVPGHDAERFPDRLDADGNGYPDTGVVVNGHYYSVFARDSHGDFYWDLGDGRVSSSAGIDSIDELDQETLTRCDYVINYRGAFDNDPFMDSGAIHNNIRCSGLERGVFKTLVVHRSDPRYTGNPAWSAGAAWEYQVNVAGGSGNLLRFTSPHHPL